MLHTPGHTPEHLAFLVTDTAAGDRTVAILTGDFVFVGDVGRPDLLERAAKVAGHDGSAARTLFRSLERFRELPDYLQLWPGHGAGSACGKALGARPAVHVGYESVANWGVAATDEAEFVRQGARRPAGAAGVFRGDEAHQPRRPALLGGSPRPRS